ncbi:hypothetical protein FRB97_001342 [Tulasnella sp. 331]|nr:hypothetical protein FRB97_001342 [Tulasnella sp. 331]
MRFAATLALFTLVVISPISALPVTHQSLSVTWDKVKPKCTEDWSPGCIGAVVAGSVGGAAVVGGATALTVHAVKKDRKKKLQAEMDKSYEDFVDSVDTKELHD